MPDLPMPDIRLTIAGPDPEGAARELAAALGLDPLPAVRPQDGDPAAAGDGPGGPRKGLDPSLVIAGAGLLLSIPGAVLAALDIRERLRKRPRAQALIAAAGRLRIERRVEVTALTLDGPTALADLDPDRLLALADPRTRAED